MPFLMTECARQNKDVLYFCEVSPIGFIPWFPLAHGSPASPGSLLDAIAKENNGTPGAVALAWFLKRSPVMLPIPGTSQVKHLEENVAVVTVTLSDEAFQMLNAQGRAPITGQAGETSYNSNQP
jgi:aryl-alcohol dehydrogenase-like predicted oxidoreductase